METVARQRAGAQRSGMSPLYQVLAEDIVAMGVEAVFGLISDDTALLATALASAQGFVACPLYLRLRPNVLPCSERRDGPKPDSCTATKSITRKSRQHGRTVATEL